MNIDECYKALGLQRSANSKQIKIAYRKKAKKYHPDLNHGNESATERFKIIQTAYDRLKKLTPEAGPTTNTQTKTKKPSPHTTKAPSRYFEMSINIEPVDAICGVTKTIYTVAKETCEDCINNPSKDCLLCAGKGYIKHGLRFEIDIPEGVTHKQKIKVYDAHSNIHTTLKIYIRSRFNVFSKLGTLIKTLPYFWSIIQKHNIDVSLFYLLIYVLIIWMT